MLSFKKIVYRVIANYPRFFGALIKFLALEAKILNPGSSEFAWFLHQTGLKIPIAMQLGNGMPIKGYLGERVSEEIRCHGYYERETVALIEAILKPGMVFFDVGTHIGQYTLLGSQLVSSTGRVYGFEADVENYNSVNENVKLNGLKNVYTTNVAISDKIGHVTLHLGDPSNLGTNSLAQPYNDSGRTAEVASLTLDSYIEANEIELVDLIKADIEGAEYLMLKGCKNLLNSDSKPILIMELNITQLMAQNSNIETVTELLMACDYEVYRIESFEPYIPRSSDPDFLNVVAVPRDRIGHFNETVQSFVST